MPLVTRMLSTQILYTETTQVLSSNGKPTWHLSLFPCFQLRWIPDAWGLGKIPCMACFNDFSSRIQLPACRAAPFFLHPQPPCMCPVAREPKAMSRKYVPEKYQENAVSCGMGKTNRMKANFILISNLDPWRRKVLAKPSTVGRTFLLPNRENLS